MAVTPVRWIIQGTTRPTHTGEIPETAAAAPGSPARALATAHPADTSTA